MAMRNITHYENEWIYPLLIGSLILLTGILMIIYKREALQLILMIVGALILVVCVVSTVVTLNKGEKPSVILLIILVALGLILLLLPGLVTDALMAILAVVLAIYGVLMLFRTLGGDTSNRTQLVFGVIVGAASLALGVYAIFNLDSTADVVMIIIGAVLAVLGALEVIRGLRIYNEYA